MIRFLKGFIQSKEKEIINESNNSVKSLNKEWADFLKKDTYVRVAVFF